MDRLAVLSVLTFWVNVRYTSLLNPPLFSLPPYPLPLSTPATQAT